MPISLQQLVGRHRAEFAKAARLQRKVLWAQIGIAFAAGAAVFITHPVGAYLAAVGTLALVGLWAWLGWSYQETRSQAERARRAILLIDGLGENISSSELRNLEVHFTTSPEEGSQYEDQNYYAARAIPGDERLAEMLEESAFWSADLMHESAKRAWLYCIVYSIVGVSLLFLSVPFFDAERLLGAARVLCAYMTLLVSTEVLGAALNYGSAARSLNALLPRFEAVRASHFPRSDLLLLFLDYNAAIEGAPMFIPGLYEKRRALLNELWNNRQPQLANQDAPGSNES
jgi:hypothetical protein